MADLEANMMHFQLMHESLARFSESFASFMYGLNMNAFCVDYPEVRNNFSRDIEIESGWVEALLTMCEGPYSRFLPASEATR